MFQTNTPRKWPEMRGSVSTRVKLAKPTLTCQPCGEALAVGVDEVPSSSSAVHSCPVAASVMQSQAAS